MKKPKLVAALAILFASAFIPSANAELFNVSDVNPDPNIFECDLTSVQKDVTINGATVHAFAFKDENSPVPPASAGLPIQVIRAKVGDLIICRYKNQLDTENASIHWHGIELDNDSDGTAVTQDVVKPGQSYTYRFRTFRPGIFWFHSHMLPGNTLFGGMYGVFIIENPIEASLIAAGTLPGAADTHTLAMSDIEFDGSGTIGKNPGGGIATENELIERCHLFAIGDPGGSNTCNLAQTPGSTVLVNGVKPDSGAQTPHFTVPSGKRIRLRLLNESISRHFKLKLLHSGDNKLYRIGGQGGLLDNVRVEGGTQGTWVTYYDPGEILIGSGMRADVIIYPTGAEGDIIQLVGNPVGGPFAISGGLPADYPIAYFQISGTGSDPAPAAGQPILAGTPEQIESIKSAPVTPLQDPAPFGGSSDETIRLTTGPTPPTGPGTFTQQQPSIDHYAAPLDSNAGDGDWLLVPHPPIARYAHVGDVLELTVRNESSNDHPYHLHGFSMQPVRMMDNAGTTLYTYDYNEFVDTVDVPGGQSYVFRTRIADRPKICDSSPSFPPGPVLAPCADTPCGGVLGRWLFHCHIVGHGALGMIGEIDILPGVDAPPQITCPADIIKNTDPGLCSAVVTFAPTATDDCGTPTVTSVPPSGSVFPKGTTLVTSTATDSSGQHASCSFNVLVIDNEAPKITCPANITQNTDPGLCSAVVNFTVTATDNCGAVTIVTTPPSGSTFPKGTTVVNSTATDTSGNTNSCSFTVTVLDKEPPQVSCEPGPNPSGKNIPAAGKNPKSGQNPDGFYRLLAHDNCDPNPTIYIADSDSSFIAGSFFNGDVVKIIQSPGHASQEPGPKDIVAQIHLKGDALLYAVDADGNVAAAIMCKVPPPPK